MAASVLPLVGHELDMSVHVVTSLSSIGLKIKKIQATPAVVHCCLVHVVHVEVGAEKVMGKLQAFRCAQAKPWMRQHESCDLQLSCR